MAEFDWPENDEEIAELIKDAERLLEMVAKYQDEWIPEMKARIRELEAENKRLRADIDEMSFTPEPETWRSGPGWKP